MENNDDLILAVDLDGTILKSDMLHESFWSAASTSWRIPFFTIMQLFKGKAAVKDFLQKHSNIDVETLPYNEEVVNYVQRFRAAGGRTILVTASQQHFAERIAAHLQIFDEVHGSDEVINLKGSVKANYLIERFGEGNFSYIGDATADLPIWNASCKIITVNANDTLRNKTERLGIPTEHFDLKGSTWRHYMKCCRPHQWIKNLLVFLPMLAAHELSGEAFYKSMLAFVAFSLIASGVYILNDLLDLNSDRSHPRKCQRPLASGAVPISLGSVLIIMLLLIGFSVSFMVNLKFFFILVVYWFMTTFYSLILKREIIVDICTLAGLYTLRILAGGVATDIGLSVWLIAFSIFFFFSLASVKRQAELQDMSNRGEIVANGRGYQVEDLALFRTISVTSGYMSVMVMSLYINTPTVQILYTFPDLLWCICAVLVYWVTRVVMITHRGQMNDDPVAFALNDRISQLCFISIIGIVLASAYI